MRSGHLLLLGAVGGGIGGYIFGEKISETVYDAFFEKGILLLPNK